MVRASLRIELVENPQTLLSDRRWKNKLFLAFVPCSACSGIDFVILTNQTGKMAGRGKGGSTHCSLSYFTPLMLALFAGSQEKGYLPGVGRHVKPMEPQGKTLIRRSKEHALPVVTASAVVAAPTL